MIYTIKGEQPFQVLNDSFSVSPSESGYDLYISADGFNYSNFATVASGVTRQFTGMNEGNYYILSGNTSEVKVNWMKDCGGGGGGSAAGVSSLDGQTGALTTKTINGNAILGSGDIEIGGGGSEVSYSQTLTAGTEIGEITIDGSATTIYAPSAETVDVPTVIDFDAMSQQERANFYTELEATWSGTSVNGDYVFLKSYAQFTPDDQGIRQFRLQFFKIEGSSAYFSAFTMNGGDTGSIITWGLRLNSDGSLDIMQGGVRGVDKNTDNCGYLNGFNQYIVFDKGTSAFTDNEGTAILNGKGLGGSFYWFVVVPIDGSWGQAIPYLPFKVIDENDVETMYYNPTYAVKSIATTTVDGVDYNKQFTANYGDFKFSFLVNSEPRGANFTFTAI